MLDKISRGNPDGTPRAILGEIPKKNVKINGGLPGEFPGRTSEGNFAGVFFLAPGGIPRGIPS